MRRLALTLALAAVLWAAPARAGERPTDAFIVAMAQHLMVAELGDMARASFGPTEIHPQPGGRFWAVVGEFKSKALRGAMTTHWYVAAVRQTCAAHRSAGCWRLEKAAVDGKVVIDRQPS